MFELVVHRAVGEPAGFQDFGDGVEFLLVHVGDAEGDIALRLRGQDGVLIHESELMRGLLLTPRADTPVGPLPEGEGNGRALRDFHGWQDRETEQPRAKSPSYFSICGSAWPQRGQYL